MLSRLKKGFTQAQGCGGDRGFSSRLCKGVFAFGEVPGEGLTSGARRGAGQGCGCLRAQTTVALHQETQSRSEVGDVLQSVHLLQGSGGMKRAARSGLCPRGPWETRSGGEERNKSQEAQLATRGNAEEQIISSFFSAR